MIQLFQSLTQSIVKVTLPYLIIATFQHCHIAMLEY